MMSNISNKEKAVALLKAIETGAQEPISYVNAENYEQHNLTVADGLDGFGAALAQLANYPEKAKMWCAVGSADNGKIAEHWDVMETIAPESEWKHQNGKFNF